jgi:predicted ferric reductase
MRRHAYEAFIKLHYGLALSSFVLLWLHILHVSSVSSFWQPTSPIWVLSLTTLLFVGTTLLQIARILWHNFVFGKPLPTARIYRWKAESGPDGIRIRVLLPRRFEVRPGQTVYLYLKTEKFWRLAEAHPFSIAWWQDPRSPAQLPSPVSAPAIPTGPRQNRRALDTQALQDISHFGSDGGPGETDAGTSAEDFEGFAIWLLIRPESGLTKELSSYDSSVGFKAAIDGPYGGHQMLHRYGHVVLFAQGIGIAAQMSYLRTAFYGSLRGHLPTRRITLVWETYDSTGNPCLV